MLVWLIREAENYPFDGTRLQRMGLIANEFVKAGHTVVWWHSTFSHFKKQDVFPEDTDVVVGDHYRVRLLHVPKTYSKNISLDRVKHHLQMAKKFYKMAKAEKQKPDLILVSMPHISFAYYATKYAKKNGIKVYVDIRDMNPDVFVDPFSGWKKRAVSLAIVPAKHMLRKAINSAYGVIATSDPYLDWALSEYGKRERTKRDRVFFVSYPYRKSNQNLPAQSKWNQYSNFSGITVCFFGQFANLVDVNTIFEAAKMCKESGVPVRFLLCGEGELLQQYREKVISDGIDNIVFPGWVDKQDIAEIGTISDAGLLAYKTSRNFSMQITNKFSEYLSFGLIPLVQPEGIMRDLAVNNQCGFGYSTSEQLFSIIRRLYENRKELEEYKGRARALYEKMFVAEVEYRNLVEFVTKESIDDGF